MNAKGRPNIVSKKIRLAVLTQEDSFAIPANIKLLDQLEFIDLISVVKLDGPGSLENQKILFIKVK